MASFKRDKGQPASANCLWNDSQGKVGESQLKIVKKGMDPIGRADMSFKVIQRMQTFRQIAALTRQQKICFFDMFLFRLKTYLLITSYLSPFFPILAQLQCLSNVIWSPKATIISKCILLVVAELDRKTQWWSHLDSS